MEVWDIAFRVIFTFLIFSRQGTASELSTDVINGADETVTRQSTNTFSDTTRRNDNSEESLVDLINVLPDKEEVNSEPKITVEITPVVDDIDFNDEVHNQDVSSEDTKSNVGRLVDVFDSGDLVLEKVTIVPENTHIVSELVNVDNVVDNGEIKLPDEKIEVVSANNNDKETKEPENIGLLDALIGSKEKSVLLKVPEKILEGTTKSGPVGQSNSYEGVWVYNEKVYPGKICNENIEQEKGDLEMPPDPLDPTCQAWSWTVTVGDGYYADVTLKSLNISHEADEFMIIGPGSSVSDLWEDQTNPIFSSVITSEKKFRMLGSESFSVFLLTSINSEYKAEFKLSFEQAERLVTTPEPTTPMPTLPTPAENVTTEIKVYLSGMTASKFNETSDEFCAVVADMANVFCYNHNIIMLEESTAENVIISLIRMCDMSWPYHADCVQVNMSVAVIQPDDNKENFELTAVHLQEMWDTQAPESEGLANLGLKVYYEPDHRTNVTIWIGGSLCVLIIFSFILMAVWRMEIFRDYSKMVGKRDSEFSHRSSTMSNDSWFPAPQHQLVPPYMDLYSEVGYVEYEPEFNGPVPTPKYQKPVLVETSTPYNGPPPRYGPPTGLGFGGAIHFYGNNTQDFDNPTFVEEDEDGIAMEEEVNTGELKFPVGGANNGKNNNSSC